MVTAFSLPYPHEAVALDGMHLTIDDVVRVARHGAHVELPPSAEKAIARGHALLIGHVARGATIYGLTTGVGALDGETLSSEDNRAFQRNLLLSHAAGTGAPMSLESVRAMLLVRANVLARGRSGARLEVVRALVSMLERGVYPYVPEIGSVGASDLAALAHAGLLLAGEGWALVSGTRVPGAEAMNAHGIALPELSGRDAFALINGPAQTLGTGALAVHDAARLARVAEMAAVLSMVGARSRTDFLDARLFEEERDPCAESARHMRELLSGAREASTSVREPLSTRCAPMVAGAFRAAIARAEQVLAIELNRPVDNPTLLADGSLTNNSGVMHAAPVAEVLDALVTSAVNVAQMSERRTARLLDPALNNGLPAFLLHPRAKAGLHSAFMIHQYTAAALVGELRTACMPATVQSIPVSNGTEDHGSMSALAARRAARAMTLAETVLAIELLTAAQAIDLRALAEPALNVPARVDAIHRSLRARVPVLIEDRLAAADIEFALEFARSQ
ncbi:aromatic amino acid ammonia-lyase [Pendulispora brunnea]|uniref:Aromatic amino acid ammonia-lyase n=1 Tax=Pendulispora brunnea TaxID=2905690 RepID=A0ABZ2KGN8_9BACT